MTEAFDQLKKKNYLMCYYPVQLCGINAVEVTLCYMLNVKLC